MEGHETPKTAGAPPPIAPASSSGWRPAGGDGPPSGAAPTSAMGGVVGVEHQVHGYERGPAGPDRRRLWWGAGAVALAVATCALVGGGLAPQQALAKKAPRLIHNNSGVGVACVAGPANTVRAKTTGRMTVVNYDGIGDWAKAMQAKARLEPTTSGLNYSRVWRSTKTGYLTQNKRHVFGFSVLTDNVSANADWQVHVKLIWDRPWPIKDITKNIYLSFDASCAGADGVFGG